ALYYGDFAKYNQYIDQHSLTGSDSWSWQSDEQWSRYRELRRASERAFQRARFVAGAAIMNRVAAVIVSSRLSQRLGRGSKAPARGAAGGLGHLQWTVEPGARRELVHRVAWVVAF